jgi:uncharacterized protein
MPHDMKRKLRRAVFQVAAVYVIFVVVLFAMKDRMIYFPQTAPEAALLESGRVLGLEPWRDGDGRLIGWHRANPEARFRAVVFHGNAGYAQHRSVFVDALEALDGGRTWEVWLMEYPGYGARPGAPGRASIDDAARSALGGLFAADARPMFLFGESIGTGAACSMAAELGDRISGLGLVVPMSSVADIAAHHYPFIPAGLLLRGEFDNVAALRGYRGPVAFVIAGEDEIVTAAAGVKLHDSYGGPKFLKIIPGVRHNDIDYSPAASWWREVSAFLVKNSQ